jgi:ribosomal protein S18 acetylase RimI-like enzyme
VYVAHINRPDRDALEAAGFAPARYHFRMQIEMTAPPETPGWPAGWTIRNHIPGADDRRVFDFIKTAFARPGREPARFDEWRAYMMREDHFRPDLWHLLFDGQELVGAALCFAYPLYGWIRQLGVDPARRRQGIGTGLLQYAFAEFYQRGQPVVALGVEATNADAYRLYERAGMRRVRQYDEYVGDY